MIFLEVVTCGSKEDKWCGDCSKCLFVYIILSPFLDEESLKNIFGKNLLDKEEMYETFLQLIGRKESKPFDCVGTYEEVNFCVCKCIAELKSENKKLPILLQRYLDEVLSSKVEKAEGICEIYEEHLLKGFEVSNLNEDFEKLLNRALKRRKDGRTY